MKKDIFYFNRQDRIVTVILLAVIVALQFLKYRLSAPDPSDIAPSDSLVWNPDTIAQPRHYTRRSYVVDTVYYSRKVYVEVPASKDDTITRVRYERKSRPLEKIDANRADSAMLVSLPGVGEWTAKKIIDYRERLGGFIDAKQIAQIDDLPDSLLQWMFVADTVPFRLVEVNKASLSQLRQHPYLNFYQARAIVELRRERGKIKGPGQLSILEEFSDRDLERLIPYLDFE